MSWWCLPRFECALFSFPVEHERNLPCQMRITSFVYCYHRIVVAFIIIYPVDTFCGVYSRKTRQWNIKRMFTWRKKLYLCGKSWYICLNKSKQTDGKTTILFFARYIEFFFDWILYDISPIIIITHPPCSIHLINFLIGRPLYWHLLVSCHCISLWPIANLT